MSIAKSVVLNCAGVGSRLGIGRTKSLLCIEGRTLISYHLELLRDVEDLRVVVGFEAKYVIDEVLSIRKDVIFVYNHDYIHTKTGASLYLGAKFGNDFVLSWDGDLVILPQDAKRILAQDGEFMAYTNKTTQEAVCVDIVDDKVLSFNANSNLEWTGICCLHKSHIQNLQGDVYEHLLPHLPLRAIKIEAFDIDTYDDYMKATEIIPKWYS